MELRFKERTVLGKAVKKLRREDFIPAEIFGHGIENRHISVPAKDFARIYKKAGETTIINLVAEDGMKTPVLITAIQRHPISREFLAIDFHQIRMDEKIKVAVPIEFKGEAPAVKAGNILIKAVDELEVEAFPQDIPHKFEVDLTVLESIKQSIHVKDLKTAKGVKILAEPETVIATITEPAKVEEVVPPSPAAETPPAGGQPTPEATVAEETKNEELK